MKTVNLLLLVLLSSVQIAFAQEAKQVEGWGQVTVWDREWPDNFQETARHDAVEDAKKQCGGNVKQSSIWQEIYFKDGGSDGNPTYWHYNTHATFDCI